MIIQQLEEIFDENIFDKYFQISNTSFAGMDGCNTCTCTKNSDYLGYGNSTCTKYFFLLLFSCPSSSIPTSVIQSFINYIEF